MAHEERHIYHTFIFHQRSTHKKCSGAQSLNFIIIFVVTDFAHGKSGEVQVGLPPFEGMKEYFLRAAEELGYPRRDLAGYYDEGWLINV